MSLQKDNNNMGYFRISNYLMLEILSPLQNEKTVVFNVLLLQDKIVISYFNNISRVEGKESESSLYTH